MKQSKILVAQLKLAIRQSGKSYIDIAAALDCSVANVKRMFSLQRMTLDRFEDVCAAIGCDFVDLVIQSRNNIHKPKSISKSQEKALLVDKGLFIYFYLLARDWLPQTIRERYSVNPQVHNLILRDLEIGCGHHLM